MTVVSKAPASAREWLDVLTKASADGEFPAVSDEGVCVYRTDDGRACAVGLLIPDDEFTENDVGSVLSGEFWDTYGDAMPPWATRDQLAEVQNAHDSLARNEEWGHEEFVANLRACSVFQGVTN